MQLSFLFYFFFFFECRADRNKISETLFTFYIEIRYLFNVRAVFISTFNESLPFYAKRHESTRIQHGNDALPNFTRTMKRVPSAG